MTNGRFIYFAGSIRGGREDQAIYLETIEQLSRYGSVLTEHVGDKELGGDGEVLGDRQIHDRDIEWLKMSDCLIAEVTTPSLGVGYELGKATEWGMPILCLLRKKEGHQLSAMIAGCRDITLREYGTTNELVRILDDFFSRL